MTELPMWNVHTLDGKKELEVIHGIAVYSQSWILINGVEYDFMDFNIIKNDEEYTLKGTVYEAGDIELINIFINYNKRYIILGK